MADTTTTNYGFVKPEKGASADTWGDKLNANWDAADAQIKANANAATANASAITTINDTSLPGKQDLDATLTAFAGLNPGSGSQLAYTSGGDSWGLTGISAFTVVLLDNADAAKYRSDLGLGGLATQEILDEDDFASNSATRPPSQQSTKAYVDALPAANEYFSSAQTITSGGLLTLAHGLGSVPKMWSVYIECVTAEHGFSVGDLVSISDAMNVPETGLNGGIGFSFDATNIYIRVGNSGFIQIIRIDNGVRASITLGNWRLRVRAFA